jgi:hypothetical protein
MSLHLITTTAAIRTCRCGALILAGIAEGLGARVDLTPIPDEPAAIRTGRETYALRGGQLHHRDDFARAAGPPRYAPILATHACPKETLW